MVTLKIQIFAINPKRGLQLKKCAASFLNMEYLSFWGLEIAPILVNLLGACVAACSKNQVPMLLCSYSNSGHAAIGLFDV